MIVERGGQTREPCYIRGRVPPRRGDRARGRAARQSVCVSCRCFKGQRGSEKEFSAGAGRGMNGRAVAAGNTQADPDGDSYLAARGRGVHQKIMRM